MAFKPMKRRDYERWIRQYGWYLRKTGTDWTLFDADGKVQLLNVIVTHPGQEIIPMSVKKTKEALKNSGYE
jgi:hypothetical protein